MAINVNETYFGANEYIMHTDNIAEAKNFLTETECQQFMQFIDKTDTSCIAHPHKDHLPDEGRTDCFVFAPSCFDTDSSATSADVSTFDGISRFLQKLSDAAARYTMKPMTLKKVVVHKYPPGASGPPHADVFPLATLLYLNDDYDGGELYFPNQNFEIKPESGSLLVFNGGGENLHGVKQTHGDSYSSSRYVFVAFWDYLSNEDQHLFSMKEENKIKPEDYRRTDPGASLLSRYGGKAEILFEDIFPVLVIKDFIGNTKEIIDFLEANDTDNGDECWGAICFREYWEKLNPEDNTLPVLVDGLDENPLPEINEKIKGHVEYFLQQEVKFSKFKGHLHIESASSPPHIHPPALAVAILCLTDHYEGGEVFIPYYDIQFRTEPGHLYIFAEDERSKHGITKVERGIRKSIVSHWQDPENNYDWAGVDH